MNATMPQDWPPADPAALAAALTPPGQPVIPPTQAQSEVITSTEGCLLVVAGAGSGKTRTMAEKVAWIVSQGLAAPHEILGVTFTKKAAAELSHRIREKLALLDSAKRRAGVEEAGAALLDDLDVDVSTYHSFANRLVADYGLRLGVEPTAPLIGEAEAFMRARGVLDAYAGNVEDLGGTALSTATGNILRLVGERAEHGASWAEIRETLAAYRDAGQAAVAAKTRAGAVALVDRLQGRLVQTLLAEQYERLKRTEGFLDFGDLIDMAVRLAREFPDVGAAERSRYRYVLLDEFQDTSHTQMELFAELFGPRIVDGEVVGARGITAVGDPNQSIYGFRGASAGQLAAFVQRFSLPGRPAGQLNLNQAWRNPRAVLDIANALSEPLGETPAFVRAPQVDVKELAPSPKAGRGEVVFGQFASFGTSVEEQLARIEALEPEDRDQSVDEVREVLAAMTERRSEIQAVADFVAARRDAPPGEPAPSVAVLSRTKSALGPIYEELIRRGIPAELTGIGALLEAPEVVEILAYLRVMTDAARSDSMLRILASPKFALGTRDLAAFGDWARHVAAVESRRAGGRISPEAAPEDVDVREAEDTAESPSLVMALEELPPDTSWVSRHGRSISEEGLRRLREARDLVVRLRRMPSDDLLDVIQAVEREIGLDIELEALPTGSPHAARRHVEALLDEAAGFARTRTAVSVSAFLDWLDLAAEHEDGLKPAEVEARADVVQLMTVHASKGLEWDVVIIPGLVEGTFPSSLSVPWTKEGGSMIPFELRGDAANLPVWEIQTETGKDFEDSHALFAEEYDTYSEREERRLAYVAVTRARSTLWLSWSLFADGKAKGRKPSTYFLEAMGAAQRAAVEHHSTVVHLGSDPLESFGGVPPRNPVGAVRRTAEWPLDPLGSRRPGFEAAQRAVIAALGGADGAGEPASARPRSTLGEAWAAEAQRLVALAHAESERRAEEAGILEIPPVISVSSFVGIAGEGQSAAEQLARPIPRRPSLAARRGTTFHAYVEEHFQRSAGFDFDELWSDSDEAEDLELDRLKENFLASEWAERSADGVEVLIETKISGQRIKGRVDAIFHNADGTWELLDWKTGRVPTGDDLRVKSLQLALYRLGWAQLKGVPEESVSACFYYVDSNTVVRPDPLPTASELTALFASRVERTAGPEG
ncbi:ATP-dependent DNA helicase [Falsarthrobacter nasiphocae]|uniref:DNA 3'-5' helicase n=1 Tax=Falsarthrobacter nasiphocae TaxID=189863 RepID=A0AAE3YE09_9MICC|nr:ATP-dependent DNA helicase [Falsarthrobacter nasiphocae]MDR6891450.1 DNA helicase-2/ATP-dependent DNA helicase PcrA [Falsarthrobacter nasiphocae]